MNKTKLVDIAYLSSILFLMSEAHGMQTTHAFDGSLQQNAGTSLTVSLPDSRVAGQRMLAHVIFRNLGQEKIISRHSWDHRDIRIRIRDANNTIIPMTAYGKRQLPPFDGAILTSGVFETVDPGEAFTWKFDLSQCFDLAPGKYSADFVWGRREVKDMHFEIFARPAQQSIGSEAVESKKLALEISIPDISGSFESNSSVAHLILKNTSDVPLDVSKTWSRQYFDIQVEDAEGKPLEILDRETVTIPPLLNDEELTRLPREILAPGKTYTWQVHLYKNFPLEQGANYKIRFSIEIDELAKGNRTPITLSSETIPFQIAKSRIGD